MTLRVVTTTGYMYDFPGTAWNRKGDYLKIKRDGSIVGYFRMENVDAVVTLEEVEMASGSAN